MLNDLIQGCSSSEAAVGLRWGFFSRACRTKSCHCVDSFKGKLILLLYMIMVAVWTWNHYDSLVDICSAHEETRFCLCFECSVAQAKSHE